MIQFYLSEERVFARPSKLESIFEIVILEKVHDGDSLRKKTLRGKIEFSFEEDLSYVSKLDLDSYGVFDRNSKIIKFRLDSGFMILPGTVEKVRDLKSGEIIANLIRSPRRCRTALSKMIKSIARPLAYPININKRGNITTFECFAYANNLDKELTIGLLKCFFEAHYSDARNSYI